MLPGGVNCCMRILIYCRRGYKLFNPDSNIVFGGAEVELYNLAVALAHNGRNSIYFLCEKEPRFPFHETRLGVRMIRIQPLRPNVFLKPYYFLQLLLETYVLLKRLQPDIIFQATAAFETGLLCSLKGSSSFVYRIENDWDVNGDFRKYKPLVSKVYEMGLRKADAVVAQTVYQKELLHRNYHRDAWIIPNAQVIPSPNTIRPFSERKYLLWVGRVTFMKRPELFLELASRHPHRSFVMVAAFDHSSEIVSSLLSRAASLPNLRLFTCLPWDHTAALYPEAQVLVMTSRPEGEGYPNVMLEAMKYGTPIYSLAWNRDETITKHGLGVCCHDRPEVFFQSLEPLLRDQASWKAYSQNAYQYASSRHNIDSITRIYEQLFQSLRHRY